MTQLNLVDEEYPNTDALFEEWWKSYPWGRRRRKMLCKMIWDELTTTGRMCRTKDAEVGFVKMFVKVTAEEILEGTKRWDKTLPRTPDFYYKDEEYIVSSPVFLNQARFADF
jgi:hypothetical protein